MFLFKKIAAGSQAVAEFQILQPERNRFILRLERREGQRLTSADMNTIAKRELKDEQLTDIIDVDIEVVDHIGPDPRTGKLRRVISQIGIPDDLDHPKPLEPSRQSQREFTKVSV